MVELKNVSKSFAEVKAVNGISFSARPGEIFGLIGPNGAGKSTTIRMIMNILAPDTGEILIDGRGIREEDKARIGYLPEERGLYRKVKVYEMLCYFASLKTDAEQVYKKNIDMWLERFKLREWKNRKVNELSKGMSQKIQFIGAIAHDPDIIFFDEPFSGLDPVSSDFLVEAIQELGQAGKTILFSTHIMEHAEKICKNIFLINQGREVLSGAIEEVKDRYGMNTIKVEFDGDGSFVADLPSVEKLIRYPRFIEVQLKEGASRDTFLKTLVERLSVRRFEVVTPSLHNIFVNMVGDSREEKNA